MAAAVIVQYIAVRSDLKTVLGWPLGAVIAQACHASTAVVNENISDAAVQSYLQDIDRMHKVVLEIDSEEELKKLAAKLQENDIKHKLWIEQPENYATCLATKPYLKKDVQSYFRKYKLLK